MLHRHLTLSLSLVALVGSAPVFADTWSGELSRGGQIEVDPATNKPWISTPEGAHVPLWDGVHRLQDGSTVTVREGVMVPNEEVLRLRDDYRPEKAFVGEAGSACDKLVRKVCGFENECSDAQGCAHAKQLQQFADEEMQERTRPGFASRFVEVPGQCREALQNAEYFKPCNKGLAGGKPTPCAELVNKVCGDVDQCGSAVSCQPAKDLLNREYAERLSSSEPGGGEAPTSGQCRQALKDSGFFAPCNP